MTTAPILTTSELTACQRLARRTMQSTATIWRATTVSDGMGGSTETWTAVATLPVRIGQPYGAPFGAERVVSDRLHGEVGMALTFPAGSDVRRTDRVVADNITYELVAIFAPETFETARRTLAKLVT